MVIEVRQPVTSQSGIYWGEALENFCGVEVFNILMW